MLCDNVVLWREESFLNESSKLKMLLTLKSFASIAASVKFLQRHQRDEDCFIRQGKLPFNIVLTLLLRKRVKSLQRVLNEW